MNYDELIPGCSLHHLNLSGIDISLLNNKGYYIVTTDLRQCYHILRIVLAKAHNPINLLVRPQLIQELCPVI